MITDFSCILEYSFRSLPVDAFIIYLCHATWTHLRHPLRKFPGLRLAAWSEVPYCYWLLRGRQPYVMLRLHEKYGPVVRIAPNELSFNMAASWKDIYGYRPGHKPFIKGSFYHGGPFVKRFGTRSLVNIKDPIEHGQMRRYLAHAFSDKSLREQEELVAEEVDTLVEKLGQFGAAERGTNLQSWLNMATFDVAGSLGFGKSFDALKDGTSDLQMLGQILTEN
jgi:cytochrome P450